MEAEGHQEGKDCWAFWPKGQKVRLHFVESSDLVWSEYKKVGGELAGEEPICAL